MRRLPSVTLCVLALIPLIAACGSDSTGPDDELPIVTLVAADRNGDIYTINETTGSETFVINTTTQNSTGAMVDVGVVSSMLYVPSTELWWLGTGGNGECDGCIQTLDPATGVDANGNLVSTKWNDFNTLGWLGFKRGVTPLDPGRWYTARLL